MKPIQHIQRFDSEYAWIEYMAQLSNLMVAGKKRLKPIEFKCFCVLVMAYNKFGDITSKSARDWVLIELAKMKGRFTPNSLVRYRARLCKKGWLIQEGDHYMIMPAFDFKKVPADSDRVFVFAARLQEKKA